MHRLEQRFEVGGRLTQRSKIAETLRQKFKGLICDFMNHIDKQQDLNEIYTYDIETDYKYSLRPNF